MWLANFWIVRDWQANYWIGAGSPPPPPGNFPMHVGPGIYTGGLDIRPGVTY